MQKYSLIKPKYEKFVRARQSLVKVHIQTSGEKSVTNEDVIEREMNDHGEIEIVDAELVPG